jgi:hypothetical protein
MKYAVEASGWLSVIEAPNKQEALKEAKATAVSASLLPTDVTMSCVSPATEEQIEWHKSMCAKLP